MLNFKRVDIKTSEVRPNLPQIEKNLSQSNKVYCVQKHNKPSLAILEWDTFESIVELLSSVMSDPNTAKELNAIALAHKNSI